VVSTKVWSNNWLNNSGNKVAIDCGCGSGSDIEYLSNQHYQVYGFDIIPIVLNM